MRTAKENRVWEATEQSNAWLPVWALESTAYLVHVGRVLTSFRVPGLIVYKTGLVACLYPMWSSFSKYQRRWHIPNICVHCMPKAPGTFSKGPCVHKILLPRVDLQGVSRTFKTQDWLRSVPVKEIKSPWPLLFHSASSHHSLHATQAWWPEFDH